jgi:hypothetical protein
MSAADVLKVCFPLLRQQKTLNAAKIEVELKMLGVMASLDEIELAWASAQISSDLTSAIAALEDGSEGPIKTSIMDKLQTNRLKAVGSEPVEQVPDQLTVPSSKVSEKDIMRDITEYKVIQDEGPSLVASQVNKAIQQGWQPLGSMSIYRGGTALGAPRDKYFQVIVKYR